MDDPFIIFRASSFFQFSDIHKIQKKTFPVRFMTNKNLFNLPRSKNFNENATLVEFISTSNNYYQHRYFW